jgi:hypothetical protein
VQPGCWLFGTDTTSVLRSYARTLADRSLVLEFRQKRVSIGILEEISKIILEKTNAPYYSTPI